MKREAKFSITQTRHGSKKRHTKNSKEVAGPTARFFDSFGQVPLAKKKTAISSAATKTSCGKFKRSRILEWTVVLSKPNVSSANPSGISGSKFTVVCGPLHPNSENVHPIAHAPENISSVSSKNTFILTRIHRKTSSSKHTFVQNIVVGASAGLGPVGWRPEGWESQKFAFWSVSRSIFARFFSREGSSR